MIRHLLAALGAVSAFLACAAPARATALPLYHIEARVDAAERRLSVDTRLELPAGLSPRRTVVLKLRDDMGTPTVEALGATRRSGALSVRRLGLDGADTRWEVTPSRPFAARRPIQLRVRHSGGESVSQLFYVGPEIVFVGGGSTAWYAQYEDGRGLGSLTLRLPAGFRALATPSREDARSPAGTARFTAEQPTQFGFIAGPYRVREERFGSRRVRLFLLSDRDFAGDLVTVAGRSIEVLEGEFGPYPFRDFAIAEVPSGPGLRSGFLGAAFDGYMLMRSDLIDARGAEPSFFGHEIAHQWWGVSVQNASGEGEYLLDEALAHYGALRVLEALEGPEAGVRFRRGDGHLDGVLDAAMLIAAGFDRPLTDLPPLPEGAPYYELSHSKGGLVYDLLARRVGRDRFRALLSGFARRHAYSRLRWVDFRAELARALGPGRGHMLDQWLDRPGLPVLGHRWRQQDGRLEIVTSQTGPAYDLELPVRLTFADGTTAIHDIDIAGASSTTTIAITQPVSAVELDPQRTVPWITPEQLAAATDAAHSTRGRVLWDSGRTPQAEAELRRGLASRTAPASGPGEFLERYYLGWIVHEAGKAAEAVALFEGALRLPVRSEEDVAQLYWRLSRAAVDARDLPKARWAAAAALATGTAPANIARQARAFLAERPAAR